MNSKLLSECKLCRELISDDARLLATIPHYKQSLSSVAGMQSFYKSIVGTPGEACWVFWIFVEDYRNSTSIATTMDMLRRLPSLFLDESSRFPLPQSIRKVDMSVFVLE